MLIGMRQSFISNVPVILTRASIAFSQSKDGTLYEFPVDVPRQTKRGRQISGAATRMHGEAPTNGSNSGATSSTLGAEGLFNPLRSISAGAVTDRRLSANISVTNGTRVYIRDRIRAGTSGRYRINCAIGANNSNYVGAFPTFSGSASASAAGALSAFTQKTLPNGDIEITFTWTPNATSASATIGIGPDSATTGEYIDIIGMQATTAFTDHIMGGTGTKAVAADIMSLDLTGLDLSAGFMLRMDGEVDATERVNTNFLYLADDGVVSNRSDMVVVSADGRWYVAQFDASVFQGNTVINTAQTPPAAFSVVGAHGTSYIGGAFNGAVATPDTVATFVAPNRFFIGSNNGTSTLPITLTAIRLVPGAPTTLKVTELAA